MNPSYAKLISDNEQDRADVERWWHEESQEGKLAVLAWIVTPHHDRIEEIVSRLAQLAFSELLEKYCE